MKKLVAIFLLGAHLLAMGGYSLVFQYFINRSDAELVKQMYESKPGSAKLIELKVPVNMPTIQDWTEYEHIVGQIQLKDGYYNYVGIKMTRDTMSLLCLPNKVKDKLVNANIIFAKNFADVPMNKKGAEQTVKKVDVIYDHVYQIVKCDYKPFGTQVKPVDHTQFSNIEHPYIESPGKPPNFSC